MADNIRKSILQDKEVDGSGAVEQGNSRLNKPLAREHQPHVSIANPLKNHVTSGKSFGKLGGKGHAGS